jgi:hypothetical protein
MYRACQITVPWALHCEQAQPKQHNKQQHSSTRCTAVTNSHNAQCEGADTA